MKILKSTMKFLISIFKKVYRLYLLSDKERLVQEWIKVDGDNTLRVEYPLNSKSLVFDVGGYKGDFASNIVSRYLCDIYVFEPVTEFYVKIKKRFEKNEKILCYNFGFSNEGKKQKIILSEDGSSIFKKWRRGGATLKK